MAHTPPQCDYVVGVDGGGTKTKAWLGAVESGGRPDVVGQGTSGPSNPSVQGVAVAGRNIRASIEATLAAAPEVSFPLKSVCLALAGVGREPIRQDILHWFRDQRLAERVAVVHDAEAVLRAGTTTGVGIALISGTGSFCFGRNTSGRSARAGGWGHWFGDEGSGYAFGNSALRAAARAADHRGPNTVLLEAVQEATGVSRPGDLVSAIHSSAADSRRYIASLAPLVFQAAADGDDVAGRICANATRELAELVVSVAGQLNAGPSEYELALTGGIFLHQSEFRAAVVHRLTELQYRPSVHSLVHDPAWGAVLLAAALR